MRLGIKAKQIAAVTTIVGLATVALSAINLSRLAGVTLHESGDRVLAGMPNAPGLPTVERCNYPPLRPRQSME